MSVVRDEGRRLFDTSLYTCYILEPDYIAFGVRVDYLLGYRHFTGGTVVDIDAGSGIVRGELTCRKGGGGAPVGEHKGCRVYRIGGEPVHVQSDCYFLLLRAQHSYTCKLRHLAEFVAKTLGKNLQFAVAFVIGLHRYQH